MRRKIAGFYYPISGVLLAIVSIFLTCPVSGQGPYMKCWYTAHVEIAVGVVIILLGLTLHMKKWRPNEVMCHILQIATAILGILLPARIIGGCVEIGMICHQVGFPCLYIICSIHCLFALICIQRSFSKANSNVLNNCTKFDS